jgi:hypothetical protein
MCCIRTSTGYFVRIYTFKWDGWLKWKLSGVSWPVETALSRGTLIGLISVTARVRAPADTKELWGDWKLRLMYALTLGLRTWNNYKIWYQVRDLFNINQKMHRLGEYKIKLVLKLNWMLTSMNSEKSVSSLLEHIESASWPLIILVIMTSTIWGI